MTVELALTPDGRWGLDAPTLAAVARGAGFSAVGLGAAQANESAAAALAAHGVRCHEVLALTLGRNHEATLGRAEVMAAAADAARAEWVLTTFGSPFTGDWVGTVARCAAMFADVGAKLAAEFSPFGQVNSIPTALDIVEAAGVDRAGVMIDTWHFFRGGCPWESLESVPLERIAYVQFDDAPEPISDDGMAETMNRRAMPGDGVFELERFAATLLERGWQGLVSVEVLNDDLRQLPVPEFARMAYQSTVRYWR
jgi:sugar phosphate isomerase/epimerase